MLRAEPGETVQALRRRLELPPLERVRELYDDARFLDAHALTREAWAYDAVSLALDVDELLLAARLALRLGSAQRHALLVRLARRRAPDSPEVELYGGSRSYHRGSSFLEARRLLDAVPEGPPTLRSDWLGTASVCVAHLRDFETAEALLASAREGEHDLAWIDTCAAHVALERGAWSEAEALSRAAWARAPGRGHTARAIVAACAKQGRSLESAELLLRFVDDGGQSFEVLGIAVASLLTVAQASTGEAAVELAGRALHAAEPLERLAPLADPRLLRAFAFLRAEAARLMGDHDLVARHARHAASPFYEDIAARLAGGASGSRTILAYRPVAQQHDTCVPASVATCASVLGLPVDQDALAGEVTWGGTALWRVREHAERQGWQVRVFTVDAAIATALLERGLPFVITLRGADMGHACAAVGIDPAMGTLILHDPSSLGTRELLLDKLHVGQAPLGPLGLLLLPPRSAVDLEGLPWPDQALQGTRLELERRLDLRHVREAAELARATTDDHDLGAYLRALGALAEGRPHAVLDALRALASRHPETAALHTMVVRCAEELGNAAVLLEVLESLVLHRRRAGVESNRAWFVPPAGLVARYASLLRGTAQAHRGQRMVHEALWREETSAPCMRVLADLAWDEQRWDDALWAYRWASTLAPDAEAAACAYAWALKKRGRRAEGLAWLHARVERAREHAASGADPWTSWVRTLEDFGEPRRALEEAERMVAAAGDGDGEHAAFAAHLLSRYGRREAAEAALAVAERHASRAGYHTAACAVAHSAGEPERALEHAIAWGREDPRNVAAFALRLRLVRGLQGTQAALALVRAQVQERPGNAELEDLLLEELRSHDAFEERERLLQRRIDDNPHEVWALRELGHDLVTRAQRSSGSVRTELVRRAELLAERCLAHDPRNSVTLALLGELALLRGELDRAARSFGEALALDPDYVYALVGLGAVMARTPAADRPALLEPLDRAAEVARHDLEMARSGARLVAAYLGLPTAEQALERWARSSPDDPRIVEARADLQLDYGLGASAAERVRPELEAAVEAYPLHAGLRLSLARAYRMLDRHVDAMAAYGRLAHDFPDDLAIQHELSQLFMEAGEPETAVELLEEVVRRGPGNAAAWMALAEALVAAGDEPRAIEQLREAHARMPAHPELLDRLLALLRPHGATQTIALTTAAIERHPDSAMLQYLHAANLARHNAPPAAVDEAFRRAIACDVHRWDAVHDYSLWLAAAGRHEDALAVLDEHMAYATDPSAVEGQRALVIRRAGDSKRALEVLCAALERHPDYGWGWQALMEWVQEDDQPAIARRMLPKMSDALVHNPGLQALALRIRQWAGTEAASLEPAWARLCADHGREPEVALLRADQLLDEGRHADVLEALDRLPKGARAEPRVLGRAIRAHVAAGDQAAALAEARACWRSRSSSSALPRATLVALLEAGWLGAVAQRLADDLEAGEHVAPGTLVSLAYAVPDDHAAAVHKRLVEQLGARTDAAGLRLLSFVFDAMCNRGHTRAVLKWRRKHPELARDNPDLWLAIGRAFSVAAYHDEVLRWFQGWRERDGLEMWGVLPYAQALWHREEWATCRDEAAWALEHVAPDDSMPRLMLLMLEASLMAGSRTIEQDLSGFVADYDRCAPALELDVLQPWERQLYAELRELASTTEPARLRPVAARLRRIWQDFGLRLDWRITIARAYVRHHVPWWQRLWIRV